MSAGWMRGLLIASLAVNLLVLGLLAGAVVSGRVWGAAPRSMDLSVGPLSEALEVEDRRAIRDDLRALARREGVIRPPRDAALGDPVAALRAEPFERDRVAAILEAQGARLVAVQRAAQDAYLDRIAALSPAARAAYADRLEDRVRHLRRDRDGDNDRDHDSDGRGGDSDRTRGSDPDHRGGRGPRDR